MKNNEIFVKCNCGCSVLSIKYDFATIWFNVYGDDFYNAQTRIKDLIRNRFDIAKHYFTKKDKYLVEIVLTKEELDDFVCEVNLLNKAVQESIEETDDESFLDSNVFIEYDKDIDEYILSIRAKYVLKDVLTGKIHHYYEPSLSKEDFNKFTKRLNAFTNKFKK